MLAEVTGGASSLILFFFLSIAVATDVFRRRIPNVLIIVMLSCGLVLGASLLQTAGIAYALLGALVGFLIMIPFYVVGGMGAGDVKLLAAIGTFLGPWGALVAGIVALIAGGVIGFLAILWRNFIEHSITRHVPLLAGVKASEAELSLPYGVAIAVGTVAAVVYADPSLIGAGFGGLF